MGVRDSNEAEVLAILEALRIFSRSFQRRLVVESDSLNAISWVGINISKPWKVQFTFNGIKDLASNIGATFHHVLRSTNGLADALAKQGLLGVIPWEVGSAVFFSLWGISLFDTHSSFRELLYFGSLFNNDTCYLLKN